MVEDDSRWARTGREGRGDFLVTDGDRAPFRFDSSVGFGGVTTLGDSALLGLLAETFGLPQANWIIHFRFGASVVATVAGRTVGSGVGSAAGLATGSFLPPHAKLIHRFFGGASTTGLVVGDTLMVLAISTATGFDGSTFADGIAAGNGVFAANE